MDAITAQTMVWQNQQAQSQQVAQFCLMLALKAEKNGTASLQIVLDNNKTHFQKMKTIFETLVQEQNLSILRWENHRLNTLSQIYKQGNQYRFI